MESQAKTKKLRVLCGCECSQVLTRAFRELGHEAFSCDLNPAYGPSASKGWHWQEDIEKVMAREGPFDIICLFPPCIYLSCVGNRWMTAKNSDGMLKFPNRQKKRDEAIAFSKRIYDNAPSTHVMLENPKGVLSTQWRAPNQRVCPTMFGDKMRKTTCLWTKGLPLLTQVGIRAMPDLIRKTNGEIVNAWHENTKYLPHEIATQIRSQLAPCFALALATQYSQYVLQEMGFDPPVQTNATAPTCRLPCPKSKIDMVSKKTPGGNDACDDETMHIGDRLLHIVVQKGGTLNIFK